MAIDSEHIISSYNRGEPILLDDPKALTEAEGLLAEHFVPYPNAREDRLEAARLTWQHRTRLEEELRKGKFNGRLLDVSIDPMEHPYNELISQKPVFAKRPVAHEAIGFVVHAALSSTASKDLGELHRPVWILPRTLKMLPSGIWQRVIGVGLGADDIDRLHQESVARGKRFGYAGTGVKGQSSRKATLQDGSEKTS